MTTPLATLLSKVGFDPEKRGKNVAIIHFDAIIDLENRQGIDYCFAAGHIKLRDLEKPQNLIQLGIRSSGKSKEFWEKSTGVQQFWANEINYQTIPEISNQIINHLKMNQSMRFMLALISTQQMRSVHVPQELLSLTDYHQRCLI